MDALQEIHQEIETTQKESLKNKNTEIPFQGAFQLCMAAWDKRQRQKIFLETSVMGNN